MLTTVEQKLSAIKAINAERERINKNTELIKKIRVTGIMIDSIVTLIKNATDDDLLAIVNMLEDHYKMVDDQLLLKAQELMK